MKIGIVSASALYLADPALHQDDNGVNTVMLRTLSIHSKAADPDFHRDDLRAGVKPILIFTRVTFRGIFTSLFW
jgi:hypothetical protein